MTGQCTSIRANELMNKSCIRVWDLKRMNDELLQDKGDELTFTKVKEFINGKFDNQGWSKFDEIIYLRDYRYLSALEGYIGLKGSNVKHIFDYLTGKVNVLKLK